MSKHFTYLFYLFYIFGQLGLGLVDKTYPASFPFYPQEYYGNVIS